MPLYKIPNERRIEAAKYRVKYRDVFDILELYKAVHQWMEENNYKDFEERKDHYETIYLEKVGTEGKREIIFRWRPQKVPGESPYFKYHLDINVHCFSIKPYQIVREGKKIETNKGEIEVNVLAVVELDYQRMLERSPLNKFIKTVFRRRLYQKEIEQHKLELYREAYVFHNYLKKWLQFKRYLPYEEYRALFPARSYPSHLKE